uniref:Ig-like domain-containing protein n=1 Tax=Cyprinus carpio TaxID=7962 RepID=A0A8C1J4D5_CYPCA
GFGSSKKLATANLALAFSSVQSATLVVVGSDSCVLVGPEIPDYRVQGEAVIIRFPFLEDVVNHRRLRVDNSSSFQVHHHSLRSERTDGVMLSERRILLLPSHPSHSGTYSYIFRSERTDPRLTLVMHFSLRSDSFCLTGSITVMIYETEEPNMTVMPYTAHAGEDTEIVCPLIFHRDVFDGQNYASLDSILSFADRESSSSHSFPYIVFPANGSFIESHLGARLVIQCLVSVGNQRAQSTDVTWTVNDQPVENSYLRGRAFQTDKSLSGKHLEVQLVILELLEEDNGTELKCICQNEDQKQEVVTQIKLEGSESVWLVGAAASSCFMLVVCVFAYHLCQRPQKPRDYVLARQDSTI